MLRTILCIMSFALHLILIEPKKIYYRHLIKTGREREAAAGVEHTVKSVVEFTERIAGITYEVEGLGNIPEGAALFVGNHQSYIDVAAVVTRMGPLKSILAKKEVLGIPLLEGWMELFDCITIDRGDARESLKSLEKVQELLEEGKSVVLFPEGTRTKGSDMLPFKAGAFRGAVRAGVQIVPFAIDGTWKLFEEHRMVRPGVAKLRILEPVPLETQEGGKVSTKSLSAEVQQRIQDALYDMRNTPPEDRTVSWADSGGTDSNG